MLVLGSTAASHATFTKIERELLLNTFKGVGGYAAEYTHGIKNAHPNCEDGCDESLARGCSRAGFCNTQSQKGEDRYFLQNFLPFLGIHRGTFLELGAIYDKQKWVTVHTH